MAAQRADREAFRCGYVAVVGRPNVGKSTLVNRLLGVKLNITSRKPQTTRHRVLGIKTSGNVQLIYVDTPGLHANRDRALNRYLNRTASSALHGVDAVVLLVEATNWSRGDSLALDKAASAGVPVILGINKIDRFADKSRLLPLVEEMAERFEFADIVPLSARRGTNTDRLERRVTRHLPEAGPEFPEEMYTDRSQRFLAAEIIREHLTRRLSGELPYRLSVAIEAFSESPSGAWVAAVVWVEKTGQKAIVIGRGGTLLKAVGSDARRDLERLLHCRVRLELWVRVRAGWSDNERELLRLGYSDSV